MASELRVDKIVPTSGVPTGGGGGIIQVVHATATSETAENFSSDAFVDTGLSATITPKFTTSKILITGYLSWYIDHGSNTGNVEWNFAVCNSSGTVLDGTTASTRGYRRNTRVEGGKHPINFIHSPNTTSAYTYQMRMNAKTSANSCNLQCQVNGTGNNTSRLTLMEISG